ncbi:unnamed protein product [Caenorhabditis bovis]|uniref:Tc1-like transposase DDE domain-containing protein n=1 Tax=Caenorhabditis bovis TaxID=2654633 RepID=A0A8S1F927_9PELO|nr:unnamed protein product [Caenorhabditis bovis]
MDFSEKIGPSKPPLVDLLEKKGKQAIVLGVLCENGIPNESIDVIVSGRKESEQVEDYHADNFSKYMKTMIPAIAREVRIQGRTSVLVMDNAPYHNKTSEKIPTSTSKKEEYCSFLLTKNGKVFHPRIKRKELWESVKDVIAMNEERLRMRKYEIYEWARTEHGVEIVRLPPYHCSLNAIELVWAQLKNQLKSIGKTTDKLETIIERTRSFLEKFSPDKAIDLLNHVRKHEDAMRQAIIDGTIVSNDESDYKEDGDDELDYIDE